MIINKIIKGDQQAIKIFHKLYSPALLSLISIKIGKSEDQEEILQDTWISILDSLPLFNFRSSFLTWAKSICLHEVADFYRKRKIKAIVFSHLPFLENLISDALGPDLSYQEREVKEEINQALSNLSEGYRKILRLKYIEGLTMVEIAKVLNVSFKSVESRLFRARSAFQKIWNEKYCESLPVSFSSSALKSPI